ncbi:MAG: FmdB family zinc ribbon protein [Pseudonocardiaceae bacterium]
MPTYSYACTECEHRFDAMQAFTDTALTDCPECQGRLRKLFSSVGIVFKGSGFYRTDSRSAPDSDKPSESEAKTGSGSADKSHSGSADKSESKAGSASGATSNSKSGSESGAASGAKSSSTTSRSARAAAS